MIEARRVRLALTCGEPAGVGPEVVLKTLEASVPEGVEPVLVGPRRVWGGVPWDVRDSGPGDDPDWVPGRPTRLSGEVAARAVEVATRMALEGQVEGVVTAPLTKEGLHGAGRPFPGHTEWLEHLCGGRAHMMLSGPRLRVVLVTTHLPLAEVAAALSVDRVLCAVRAAHRGLVDDLGIHAPRVAVAALNPHAGEGGLLGVEERRVIDPAVAAARREGIDATGPWPADSLFPAAVDGRYDVVVPMYHDQGLVPLKLLHFHDGVNVTLGLPIVRTSPDHGTAFDIAGTGRARPDSFAAALRMAAEIARRRCGGVGERECSNP